MISRFASLLLFVAALGSTGACAGGEASNGETQALTEVVVPAFPASMSGTLTAYAGPKNFDPDNEAAYNAATGHTNYGVGGAVPPFFEALLPEAQLRARRKEVRAALWQALLQQAGDPRTPPVSWDKVTYVAPKAQAKVTRQGRGYVKRQFFFDSPLFQAKISGVLLVPDGVSAERPAPAVMYSHYHGAEFWVGTREVDGIWDFPDHGSFGEYLVDLGFVVFGVDALGFNQRRIDRGKRPKKVGATAEDTWDELGFTQQFAKKSFAGTKGRSRFAVRTFEDIFAFRLLQKHPFVDKARISAMGMSMGCVRSVAMAALVGEQLASVVALGTFPRWQDLARADIKEAHHNAHFFTGQISDMRLDTEALLLTASTTNVLAIMGNSPDDPQDGQSHPQSPDAASPGWPLVFEYAEQVASTLGEKEFRPISAPGVGHDWSAGLVDEAMRFISLHSGVAVPNCEGREDGLYCGDDQVDADPDTLYRCAAEVGSVAMLCPAGCRVNDADTDDACE